MTKPRKSLPKALENLLWVLSGGICAFKGCNNRLVFEEAGKTFNLADKAHIIAHSPDGPRGEARDEYSLSEEEIDSPKNLILFCKNHHDQVDQQPELYPADMLFKWKHDHEEWVRNRLSEIKTSIAILHKTKGPQIDAILLADSLNLKVFGLACFQENLDDISKIDWDAAVGRNIEVYREAMNLLQEHEGVLFNVFPLSQIPLLIHLGNMITDTIPIQVFQYDRDNGVWVLRVPGENTLEDLNLKSNFAHRDSDVLIVSVGVSSKIYHKDIDAVIPIKEFDFLEITVDNPEIDRVLYKEDVDKVKKFFKRETENLNQINRYKEIHLFYAGPAGLAVEMGRAINKKMWPDVYLYHYDYRREPRYERAFCI